MPMVFLTSFDPAMALSSIRQKTCGRSMGPASLMQAISEHRWRRAFNLDWK